MRIAPFLLLGILVPLAGVSTGGDLGPDPCMLDPQRVEVIGPRYKNGVDVLDLCNAQNVSYRVEGAPGMSMWDIADYCVMNHKHHPGFHSQLGFQGCMGDFTTSRKWADTTGERSL